MRVDRINPYLVRWAPHGTLAAATHPMGLVFLDIDAEAVLGGSVKWKRRQVEVDSPIIDMCFGPMFTAGARAALAVVTQSGRLYLFGEEEMSQIAGYTAIAWLGQTLVASSDKLQGFAHDLRLQFEIPVDRRVVHLAASENNVAVVFDDNSIYEYDDMARVMQLATASTTRVESIEFNGNWLIHRCGSVDFKGLVTECSPVRGTILPLKDDAWAIVHADGTVEGLIDTSFNQVSCATRHPSLPLGVAMVEPKLSGWTYPIPSWQSASIALFTLEEPNSPEISSAAFPAAWVAHSMGIRLSSPEVYYLQLKGSLEDKLRMLFRSKEFDEMRTNWFRTRDVQPMRASIAQALQGTKPSTKIDEVVLKWYAGEPRPPFMLKGDLAGKFDGTNSEWRACALTGLPLLSIEVRRSEDGEFAAYEELNEGVVVQALLRAADFCIFSGSLWKLNG